MRSDVIWANLTAVTSPIYVRLRKLLKHLDQSLRIYWIYAQGTLLLTITSYSYTFMT